MATLAKEFELLPEDLQAVLRLAQEQHGIRVTPLAQLGGGRSGAFLYLVSASQAGSQRVEHLILKLDRKHLYGPDEVERHRMARTNAPAAFARDHMPDLAMDQVERGDFVAIFYTIAGESLQNYRPLSGYGSVEHLETIFQTVSEGILRDWNEEPSFEEASHPQSLLARWLGYRLEKGGAIERFFEEAGRIPPETPGLLIDGRAYPNPLAYGRSPDLWPTARRIDSIVGFQHGDLNTGNVLAEFSADGISLKGYYLIDFALYKEESPLLYDHAYLEFSYLLGYLSQSPFARWTRLATHFAESDLLEAGQVPVELAGAASATTHARRAFQGWVEKHHPSLVDDLWGQFLLAATAVGLNFCNKRGLSDPERLAALIYAAAHLRRYFLKFQLPLPADVAALPEIAEGEEAATLLRPRGPALHNLPAEITSLVGREGVLRELTAAFEDPGRRLISLVGPGGIGKTRLAVRAAHQLRGSFADGIFFVPLASVKSALQISQAMADALEFPLSTEEDPELQILNHLRRRRLLLVMDNFEHLLEGTGFLHRILETAPGVMMLVTSREELNLTGEKVIGLTGLTVGQWRTTEKARESSAVQLFLQRAENTQHGFALREEDLPEVERILRLVGGNPLGILLAASWVDVLSPREIAIEISKTLDFLQSEALDLPTRQRSLRAAFDTSWSLLKPEEKALLQALSVFRGGFTREAGQKVTGAPMKDLAAIERKSLLYRAPETGRFGIHEGIQQYAEERLGAEEEARAAAYRAHAGYYANFVENRLEDLRGRRQGQAHREIKDDIANIRAAWHYWVSERDADGLSKFLDGLLLVYDLRGWYHEAVDLYSEAAEVLQGKSGDPEAQVVGARASAIQGYFTSLLGFPEEGLRLAGEAVASLRQMHRRAERLVPLSCLAINAVFLNRDEEVEAAGRESLEIAGEMGVEWAEAASLVWLAMVPARRSDLEEASRLAKRSLSLFEGLGDLWGQTWPLFALGTVAVNQGDTSEARAHYERGLRNCEEIGFRRGRELFHKSLGDLALQEGEIKEAEEHYLTSLAISEEISQSREMVGTIYDLARLRAEDEREEAAVKLLGLVVRHPASGQYSALRRSAIREETSRLLKELEDRLPREDYTAARNRARGLELETVIDELLGRRE